MNDLLARRRFARSFPWWAALSIALAALLLPRLAERTMEGALVVDRGPATTPLIDRFALAQPIRVISFDVVGAGTAILLLLACVSIVGFIGWWAVGRNQRSSPGTLLTLQALAGGLLALSPISFSPDPTAYVLYARLWGVLGVNPYRFPVNLPSDGIVAAAAPLWGPVVPANVYGPFWTLLAASFTRLVPSASLLELWTMQRFIAVAAAVIAAAGLLWILRRAGSDMKEASARVALFSFHPFVLLETAINGHNDMVMVACAVWAFALLAEAPLVAGLLLGASVAAKFVTVVVVPFFLVLLWRTHGKRLAPAFAALAGMGVAVAAAFAPFWIGPKTLQPILSNQSGVAVSPAALLADAYLALTSRADGDPVFPGQRHWRVLRHASAGQMVDFTFILLWMLLAAFLWYRFVRTGERTAAYLAITSCMAALPALGSYYLVWISPLVVERTRWGTYIWWLCATAMLFYAQSFLGRLSWQRASDIYMLALLLLPLLIVRYCAGVGVPRLELLASGEKTL